MTLFTCIFPLIFSPIQFPYYQVYIYSALILNAYNINNIVVFNYYVLLDVFMLKCITLDIFSLCYKYSSMFDVTVHN